MKIFFTTAILVAALVAPAAMGQRIDERKERQKARVKEGKGIGRTDQEKVRPDQGPAARPEPADPGRPQGRRRTDGGRAPED